MITINKKMGTVTLCLLALISACGTLPTDAPFQKQKIELNANNKLIIGTAEFPKKKTFNTLATIYDVRTSATVALLYPSDHPTNPNQTVATGLSASNGSFIINPDISFSPAVNEIYVLEATKRIGNAGKALMSVRTYLQWTGTFWKSISTPKIRINKNTTALTIINDLDSSVSAEQMIDSMLNETISDVGTVNVATINQVATLVDFLLTSDVDPTKFISLQNNKYFISRETAVNRMYLASGKDCPNCELIREEINGLSLTGVDLSNANLTGSNLSSSVLTNANLSNANLTSANLSSANLSGANLSGATLTAANLSGATWTNGTTICVSGSSGRCIFPDQLINTYTTNGQINPAIAMDADGDFVITWQSSGQDGSLYGIYAQRYASDGTAAGTEFQVNTYTNSTQINPVVAMDADGDFVITWQSSGQDGSAYGIYAQRYTSTGSASGSEFRVNTYTTNVQSSPAVAIDTDGDFVITWQSSTQDGALDGIYAQRYASDGTPSSVSEFRVNTYTTSNQSKPSVAMDSDGDFVITWHSSGQDGSLYGIYAQRYTSAGALSGLEFRVNTYTSNMQKFPVVTLDADGDFVISWQSSTQDGNNYGIFAQRYTSGGSVNGTEFQVNTYTTGTQRNCFLVSDLTGNFAISWESAQDGNNYGVYLKKYDSSGNER